MGNDESLRYEYWTVQVFYHKKPKNGHCLELDFDRKSEALQEARSWRDLGYKVKIHKATDLPLSFSDSRDTELPLQEKEIIIIPAKRGRKAKYL